MVVLAAIFFSGCTNTNGINQTSELKKFIGTWTGNKDISNFGGRSNDSITQLIFMDNIVAVTLTNERGTNIMNYTYKLDGDKLILEPKFDDLSGFARIQPSNDTRPWNDSELPNDTRPWNGTEPPNGTWAPNGTIPANDGQIPYGQRPSMSIYFIYSFNKEFDIFYLDESQFIKI